MSARPCITRITKFSTNVELPGFCAGLLDDKCSKIASSHVTKQLVKIYEKLGSSLEDLTVSIDTSWIGIIVYDKYWMKTYWELYVYNKPKLEVYVVEIKVDDWCKVPIQFLTEM